MEDAASAAAAGLVRAATDAGLTFATAESLTAGRIAATVATVPGASTVLRGGLVVYATDLKVSLAGVDPVLLDRVGPVDPTVAGELARGAALRCQADLGVGVTGVAGPDRQDGHPVGEVWIGVWGRNLDEGRPRVTSLDEGWRDDGGTPADDVRDLVRWYTVLRALEALRGAVDALDEHSSCTSRCTG
nr:CinA family protein [Corynebacterium terpenotabidum]